MPKLNDMLGDVYSQFVLAFNLIAIIYDSLDYCTRNKVIPYQGDKTCVAAAYTQLCELFDIIQLDEENKICEE